jgi:hypothetical protein
MTRMRWIVPLVAAGTLCGSRTLGAQEQAEGTPADVAKAVSSARVALERGLEASMTQGRPISGKFEIEDGHLQLSVYTAKDGKFSEVIVDYNTGKVTKAEAITGGEDLKAATDQSAAMAKATVSLRATVEKALRTNPGFRALSVTPSLKGDRPIADVTLAKGTEVKTVLVPLQ